MMKPGRSASKTVHTRSTDAPYRIWGADLEPEGVPQMTNACRLPVAVSEALMPDAHVGYGLPVGGVLATRDAVLAAQRDLVEPAGPVRAGARQDGSG
jgi:tRNA-splicing ligase RtcB